MPSPLLLETFPDLKRLTRRQLEILQLKNIPIPDPAFQVIDLSQNLGFSSVVQDKMPCITPDGSKFLTQRVRFLTGAECLRFQGIFLPEEMEKKFKPNFLQDLAGNSYETTSCAASLLCGLLFLAQNASCKKAWASSLVVPFPRHPSAAKTNDDDEIGPVGDSESDQELWATIRSIGSVTGLTH